jgi:AcrR family transcriptional regulator
MEFPALSDAQWERRDEHQPMAALSDDQLAPVRRRSDRASPPDRRRLGNGHHLARPAGKGAPMTTVADVEAEFDRFVAALIPAANQADRRSTASPGGRRGRNPSIAAETIYQRALEIVDGEGVQALTVRRLAADIKISTRTLYKRILNRDNLIRKIVELHFSELNLVVRECDSWESTALGWCVGLHTALCAHPHLTDLMTDDDVAVLNDYADRLVDYAVREGFSRKAAAVFCRALASVTINDAIREVRAACHSGCPTLSGSRAPASSPSFGETVRLILVGVRAESPDLRAR